MFLKIHKRKKDGQTSTQIWKDVIKVWRKSQNCGFDSFSLQRFCLFWFIWYLFNFSWANYKKKEMNCPKSQTRIKPPLQIWSANCCCLKKNILQSTQEKFLATTNTAILSSKKKTNKSKLSLFVLTTNSCYIIILLLRHVWKGVKIWANKPLSTENI